MSEWQSGIGICLLIHRWLVLWVRYPLEATLFFADFETPWCQFCTTFVLVNCAIGNWHGSLRLNKNWMFLEWFIFRHFNKLVTQELSSFFFISFQWNVQRVRCRKAIPFEHGGSEGYIWCNELSTYTVCNLTRLIFWKKVKMYTCIFLILCFKMYEIIIGHVLTSFRITVQKAWH